MSLAEDSISRVPLAQRDPEVAAALKAEQKRQQDNLIMIASENLVSRAVLEAQGSVLTNKYAEGYPGARYYGGCSYVDRAEELARTRALQIFGAEHVNVQPHSGTSANMAVYLALLKPGDRLLGMDLSHGGHLTHGSKVNISGRYYDAYSYGVDRGSNLIDLEQVRARALEVRPKLVIAGASSYPRQIDFAGFKDLAAEVGAIFMVDMAHTAGLIAAGVHPSPVGLADIITATTHKTFRGPRGGLILSRKDYASCIDKAVFPGLQGGPLMHVIAAKAVAFKEAQQPEFVTYQEKVLSNAKSLAAALTELGFDLVTGGTDTHLVLVDLRRKKISGNEAERLFEEVQITANKNIIPYDPKGANDPSGIRLGTPTLTSRGMGSEEMVKIAAIIGAAIDNRNDRLFLDQLKKEVNLLTSEFPVY
ncbi:MAG: serine hydroxymethyltransferase [Firmicutes bacterium]|nr:serine hydroxymethyltransferase [Bacillota bacterium]